MNCMYDRQGSLFSFFVFVKLVIASSRYIMDLFNYTNRLRVTPIFSSTCVIISAFPLNHRSDRIRGTSVSSCVLLNILRHGHRSLDAQLEGVSPLLLLDGSEDNLNENDRMLDLDHDSLQKITQNIRALPPLVTTHALRSMFSFLFSLLSARSDRDQTHIVKAAATLHRWKKKKKRNLYMERRESAWSWLQAQRAISTRQQLRWSGTRKRKAEPTMCSNPFRWAAYIMRDDLSDISLARVTASLWSCAHVLKIGIQLRFHHVLENIWDGQAELAHAEEWLGWRETVFGPIEMLMSKR